mmetsp:Transcript_32574/g.62394  ORF Transcript_32574/g.62394 Transcript_32574/m.62394 type:complete len:250 (+) Transcript_32574:47-796(+)
MTTPVAPTWANVNNTNRPPPIEDHHGTSSGDGAGGSSHGMDDLLAPVCTLDEPVTETIIRDVRAVGGKLKAVLLPLDRNSPFGYVSVLQEDDVEPSDGQRNVLNQLRDWDLWGPLFICLSLALILTTKAPAKQTSHVFTTVFIVMWIGSFVVTINAQLLGANISIFQSLCVLGYCVFPLTVSALVIAILRYTWFGTLWLDLIWLGLGFVWATRVSSIFVGQFVKRERRLLALYPVFFFYLLLGWLILLF